MHVAARARLVLARHPWVYWAAIAALASIVAATVHNEMSSIAVERNGWGATRTVLVAQRRLEPGDLITADHVVLPVAALPDSALTEHPVGAVVRQRVAAGSVLTELDVTSRDGPAALAEPGTIVVALSDPLARDVVAGLQVRVAADGLILAATAEVTDVVDDVIFVAVDEASGPIVAAAAQQGIASLLYLP